MVISLRFEHKSDLVTKRNHDKIMNKLHRTTMERHQRVGLPARFRQGPKTRPGGEFDFEKRSLKYQRRKKKRKGHLKPNVWTGKTLQRAKSAQVRATAKGGRIYFRSHFRMRLSRLNEFERISPLEVSKYIRTMKREYVEMANSPQYRRKRKRKIK